MYVVIEFVDALPAHRAALQAAIVHVGRQLTDKKLGCLVFDIAVDEFDEQALLLYHVYSSKAAHIAHVELPEYADHRVLVDPWIVKRRQLTYTMAASSRPSS